MAGRTKTAIAGMLVLAGSAVLAAAAFAGYVISNSAVRQLPMQAVRGINAACPAGSNLSGGGFKATGPGGIVPLSHFPVSAKKFNASLKNTSSDPGDPEATIQSIAVCDENGRFKIVQATKVWQELQTRTAEATCPRGMRVSGGGIKVPGADFATLGNRPKGKRVWQIEGYNGGFGQQQATAYAICDKDGGDYTIRKESGIAPPERAALRGGAAARVQVRSDCESGERATGGGYSIDATGIQAHASIPKAHRWRVTFFTHEGDPTEFHTYAICKA